MTMIVSNCHDYFIANKLYNVCAKSYSPEAQQKS